MTSMDVFSLLTFPSNTNGLSAYKPVIDATVPQQAIPASGSDSPPRKSARLEGDSDHSDSAHRLKDKGKGSPTATPTDGIIKLTLLDPPESNMTEAYFDSLLPIIHKHICAILSQPTNGALAKPLPSSHGNVYQATRTIVLVAKKGQWIYDKLKFELKVAAMRISTHLTGLKQEFRVDWLEELVSNAVWFEKTTRLLESVLTYLDRIFVSQKSDLQHIRELAMGLFNAHVFQHAQILLNIKDSIREWAIWEHNERNGHPKRVNIITLIGILGNYSLFTSYFLTTYVEVIQAYYSSESERLAETLKDSPGTFLVHCDQRIQEEIERSREVLMTFEPCWNEIIRTTEKSLLEGRLKWLSLGVKTALDNKDAVGLARMYNLFSRVDGLKMLCDTFRADVNNKVSEIVKDREHDEEMVDRLLEFKAFIDSALPTAFSDVEGIPTPVVASSSSNPSILASTSNASAVATAPEKRSVNRDFIHAATDAFASGFRVRRNKPAEMIAKFLDRAMRRGQKGSSDEEFMHILDSVLGLYHYTQDKDVFRTFYHRALAKRLLLQRSASDDFEKAVLKQLKEQFDPEFSMGDHMFRDLALSRDLMREFHEKTIGGGSAEKLNVMVLQRSFWPFSAKQKEDLDLPANMQGDLQKFAAFYKSKHQGRKLDFDHSLGTVQMRARFKGGEKELSLSLYQAVVLLLFNEQVEIGFKDIMTNTGMEDGELRRTLQSLACANKKVLKKRPVGKEVNDSDVFYFNDEFTDPKTRVHINSIQVKETPEESQKTQSGIDSDRKHYLDAAIVRIMKAKKSMKHQPLISATIDAVKAHFAPEVRMIKERIEQLIEQEYMRRDEDQDNVYVYVA